MFGLWLIAVSADRQAVLAAGRITWMVIRGGRLGSRPWTEPISAILFYLLEKAVASIFGCASEKTRLNKVILS